MAGKTIEEFDFSAFVTCSVRATAGTYTELPELEAAKVTMQWLLSETFNDRLPQLGSVRAVYEQSWARLFGECPKPILRNIPRMSKRMHDLAVSYIVMHPAQKYALSFGRHVVRGSYSAILKPRKKQHPLILRLRAGCAMADEFKLGPNTVNMLRWLHFRQFEATYPAVRVLNYSIDSEEAWTDFFDEKIVKKYVQSAASNLSDQRICPSPGEHCKSCQVPSCMDAMEASPLG